MINRLLALDLIERLEPDPDAPRPLGDSEPPLVLKITDAGLTAIGIETDAGVSRQEEAARHGEAGRPEDEGGEALAAADAVERALQVLDPPGEPADASSSADRSAESSAPTGMAPTPVPERFPKLAIVLDLLRRPEGASLDELVAATGWQRHSVRGAIAGSVKRKLGHTILLEKQDGIRRYRIKG